MVLVTGANGFVGRAVCAALSASGLSVRAAVRDRAAADSLPPEAIADRILVGFLDGSTDWSEAVRGVEAVVHLAARVHVMRDNATDPELEFRRTNTDSTIALAEAARDAGARRFIFVSSIKVNGEATPHRAFQSSDPPAPADAYGRSKLAAEQGLTALQRDGFEVAIARPPLVYGPGVKANFRELMKLASGGLPLPLGAIRNARSFVGVWNLADFIVTLVSHSGRVGGTWLVSDGQDLSTPDLVRELSAAFGKRALIFPVPVVILRAACALLGRASVAQRLTDSLVVDSSPARQLLGWQPPVSVREGFERTVRAYRAGISTQ